METGAFGDVWCGYELIHDLMSTGVETPCTKGQ
jgi:hypothetical protein